MIKLTPKQKKAYRLIMQNTHKETLFDGAARAGKSYVIIYCLIVLCLTFDKMRVLIAREKLNHAISSIWMQTLIPMLEEHFNTKSPIYKVNKSLHIITFSNGSEIWLGGLDSKERTDKILGQEYAIIFLNEIVQLSLRTVEKVKTRLAQKINGFTNMLLQDCNPRMPAHWVYKRHYVEKPKGCVKLTWTTYDNKEHVAEGFIDNLKTLSETEKKRFLEGVWCDVEGAVYHNVLDAHQIAGVSKDWGRYDDITIGIDWGYHMHCSVWGIRQKEKLEATCMYEFAITGGKTSDLINEMNKYPWFKRYKAYCDHEPDRILELCDADYIADKAYKEVGAGDSSVNEYDLYFDSECCETFQSMLNLMHQQDKNDDYIEQHEKVNDHGADSARYALHGWRKDNADKETHFFIKRR